MQGPGIFHLKKTWPAFMNVTSENSSLFYVPSIPLQISFPVLGRIVARKNLFRQIYTEVSVQNYFEI